MSNQFRSQRPRVSQPYGAPRNPLGIRVPSYPKLKLGPTQTAKRRVTPKTFFGPERV